jgi:hypothetical protein
MSAFSSKAAIPPAPICELRIRRSGKRRCFENDFLARKKIAGKLGTCASDVARMLELNQCHEERRTPASTSSHRTAPAVRSGFNKL